MIDRRPRCRLTRTNDGRDIVVTEYQPPWLADGRALAAIAERARNAATPCGASTSKEKLPGKRARDF
jgi:hypothetical protein